MYQLIESNGKEMKEVLSSGKTIWRFEQDADNSNTVQLLDYEEYDVEVDLETSEIYIHIKNIPDTFKNRHKTLFMNDSTFKERFSHIEIFDIKFDFNNSIHLHYSAYSKHIHIYSTKMKRALIQDGWTTSNNKIKLYYRDTKSIKRVGRRLSVIRSGNQIAILGASDIDFRYFEIGSTGVLKRETAISATKAIVVTDVTQAKSVIDEFNIDDLAEEKLDIILYLN